MVSFSRGPDPTTPQTPAALGKLLFFDPILSRSRSVSCASCHREKYAFADTTVTSLGELNKKGTRNSPSAMNVSSAGSFFWDGRAGTLEEQALIPIANPDEMNLPLDSAVNRLQASATYSSYFLAVFHEKPTLKNLGLAIALFEKTLDTYNTPFDDWQVSDNDSLVSPSAKRGFALFNGKAKCSTCHFGGDFNNGGIDYRNIGLFDGRLLHDSGRAALTKKAEDLGRFKIPDLRNVAITAPYMHNGMFRTLREVIDYYNDPDKVIPNPINRDPLLSKPLNLTATEKTDLESFLKILTDKRFVTGQ
jgi:cytochrome c peroxidase